MWIFCEVGFVSVVQDLEDHDVLVVRARLAEDVDALRRYVPELSLTVETPTRDYAYRATCRRDLLALGLARLVMNLDYSNFKSSVAERQGWPREALYSKVWSVMANAAAELSEPGQ